MTGALSSFLGAAQALYQGAGERVAPMVGGGAGLAARGAEVARDTVRSVVDRGLGFLRAPASPAAQKSETVQKTNTTQLKSFLAKRSKELIEEELEDFLSESMELLKEDVAHFSPTLDFKPLALPDFARWCQGDMSVDEVINSALEKNTQDNVENLSDNAEYSATLYKVIEYFKKQFHAIKKAAIKLPEKEAQAIEASIKELKADLLGKRKQIREKTLSYLRAKIHFLSGETEWPILPEPQRPSPTTGKLIAFSQAIPQEISLLKNMLMILSDEERNEMATSLGSISERVAPNPVHYPAPDSMRDSTRSLESL